MKENKDEMIECVKVQSLNVTDNLLFYEAFGGFAC
jgi:hypothetical protein